MFDPALQALRAQLAEVARTLAGDGFAIGTSSNLSACLGDRVVITPAGMELAACGAQEIVVTDRSGAVLEESGVPSSELALHLGAYARFGSGAVIHTHSPQATALACVLTEPVALVHYAMAEFGGEVAVAPYATPGTAALAEVTLGALAGRTAALMANHGAVVLGEDLGVALSRARLLEWVSGVYLAASRAGAPRALGAEQRRTLGLEP